MTALNVHILPWSGQFPPPTTVVMTSVAEHGPLLPVSPSSAHNAPHTCSPLSSTTTISFFWNDVNTFTLGPQCQFSGKQS